MELESYLRNTARAGVKACETGVEDHVDVAIIGGGFIGLYVPLAQDYVALNEQICASALRVVIALQASAHPWYPKTDRILSNLAEMFASLGNARIDHRRAVSSTPTTVCHAHGGKG
jgi:hypothetical protein